MSASTATAMAADIPRAKPAKGKKKLILVIVAAVLLLALGGGGAVLLLKKKPVDVEESAAAEGDEAAEHSPVKAVARHDPTHAPVFVPLDPFTVNLADRDAERYAQVGITLEIDDAKIGEQIKVYMPAIRNNILMAIADRNAAELLGREGKASLAERVKRETARALGYDIPAEEADAPGTADDEGKPRTKAKPKAKKRKNAEPELPIRAVHFSNFIIQ